MSRKKPSIPQLPIVLGLFSLLALVGGGAFFLTFKDGTGRLERAYLHATLIQGKLHEEMLRIRMRDSLEMEALTNLTQLQEQKLRDVALLAREASPDVVASLTRAWRAQRDAIERLKSAQVVYLNGRNAVDGIFESLYQRPPDGAVGLLLAIGEIYSALHDEDFTRADLVAARVVSRVAANRGADAVFLRSEVRELLDHVNVSVAAGRRLEGLSNEILTSPLRLELTQALQNAAQDRASENGAVHTAMVAALIASCLLVAGVGVLSSRLGKSHVALERAKSTLEERVSERTSELMTAKDAAEDANRAKSDFLGHFSHELRTPLNAIIGFSEVMTSELLGPMENAQYADYAKNIHSSGRNLLALVDQILEFTTINAPDFRLKLERVDARAAVADAVELVQPGAKARDVAIKVVINARDAAVTADKAALQKVLRNMISNAVKYSNDGGAVSIRAKIVDDARLRVSVMDEGCGISPEDIKRLGEPFYRSSDPYVANTDGAGLGLAITKTLLNEMESSFDVESKLGTGATFSFELALAEDDKENAEESDEDDAWSEAEAETRDGAAETAA